MKDRERDGIAEERERRVWWGTVSQITKHVIEYSYEMKGTCFCRILRLCLAVAALIDWIMLLLMLKLYKIFSLLELGRTNSTQKLV